MILLSTILILKTLGYKIAWYWYILALTEFCNLKIRNFNLIKIERKYKNERLRISKRI